MIENEAVVPAANRCSPSRHGGQSATRKAAGGIAGRGSDSSKLLGLFREPPAGVSREMVARALGHASLDLDTGLRCEALRETAGDRRVQEAIARALSPVERVALARMLEKTLAPGTAEILGRQLRGETDSKVRCELARILGRIREQGLAQLAESLHGEGDERYRQSLLWGLEAARRPVAPEARSLFVEAASGDPSASIRSQAAEVLVRQPLSGLFGTEPNRDVRERIERATGELEGRRWRIPISYKEACAAWPRPSCARRRFSKGSPLT